MARGGVAEGDERMYLRDAVVLGVLGGQLDGAAERRRRLRRSAAGARVGRGSDGSEGPLRFRARLSSSLLGKGFDGHEAQPVAGGLVAVDDPTECKLAYLVVVSHPAGETVAYLIEKFLQRRFTQRLWFAWLRSRLHLGYVVAKLPGSVPPHPFRGSHRLWVLRVTSLAHVRNVARSSTPSRSSTTRTHCSASRSKRRRAARATGSRSPRNWPGAEPELGSSSVEGPAQGGRTGCPATRCPAHGRDHASRPSCPAAHRDGDYGLVKHGDGRPGISMWISSGSARDCWLHFHAAAPPSLGAYVAIPTRRYCGSRSRW